MLDINAGLFEYDPGNSSENSATDLDMSLYEEHLNNRVLEDEDIDRIPILDSEKQKVKDFKDYLKKHYTEIENTKPPYINFSELYYYFYTELISIINLVNTKIQYQNVSYFEDRFNYFINDFKFRVKENMDHIIDKFDDIDDIIMTSKV